MYYRISVFHPYQKREKVMHGIGSGRNVFYTLLYKGSEVFINFFFFFGVYFYRAFGQINYRKKNSHFLVLANANISNAVLGEPIKY